MGSHIISGLSQLYLDLIQGAEIGEVFACPLMLTVQLQDRSPSTGLTDPVFIAVRAPGQLNEFGNRVIAGLSNGLSTSLVSPRNGISMRSQKGVDLLYILCRVNNGSTQGEGNNGDK